MNYTDKILQALPFIETENGIDMVQGVISNDGTEYFVLILGVVSAAYSFLTHEWTMTDAPVHPLAQGHYLGVRSLLSL